MEHLSTLLSDSAKPATPIHAIGAEGVETALQGLDENARRFALAQGFKADSGRIVLLPDERGEIGAVLFGLGSPDSAERNPLLFGKLATGLPAGDYRLAAGTADPELAALAFALGGYRFERYRKPKEKAARLLAPE